MDLPEAEPKNTFNVPSVILAEINSSPGVRLSAIMPPVLGLLYAIKSVFLTRPFLVAIKILNPGSNAGTLSMVVSFSSLSKSRKLTRAFPRLAGPALGISYTLHQ